MTDEIRLERMRDSGEDKDWFAVGNRILDFPDQLPPDFINRIKLGEEVYVGYMAAHYRLRR